MNPATVSAAVNVANFIINQDVKETDTAMLRKIEEFSVNNVGLGVPSHEKLLADSPMVMGLRETFGPSPNFCPAGFAYVFYARKSLGKSSAVRYFCRKDCKKNSRRSIHVGASGGSAGTTYFERIAADLKVDYSSNWARCLVAAMTKKPEEKLSPILFLDEFNERSKKDLQDLNKFMRECQNLGFYLIVVTSERTIANDVMGLNAWEKMRPLKFIHNGPTENIQGQPGYEEDKAPDWKDVYWTQEQLKMLVIAHEGEFDDYSFILRNMTPSDALFRAREAKEAHMQGDLVTTMSSLSAGG